MLLSFLFGGPSSGDALYALQVNLFCQIEPISYSRVGEPVYHQGPSVEIQERHIPKRSSLLHFLGQQEADPTIRTAQSLVCIDYSETTTNARKHDMQVDR